MLLGALRSASLLIIPMGGADMPVVISMLNAFTGLSAAAAGFVLDNNALIIAGSLVGSSGTLLTMHDGTRDEPLARERAVRRLRRDRRRAGGTGERRRPVRSVGDATTSRRCSPTPTR